MSKLIPFMLILSLILMLTGCNSIEERKAEGLIKDYYQSMIDENFEAAFEQLHLFQYDVKTDDYKLDEEVPLSAEEAKEFYLEKIDISQEKGYKLTKFQIGEVEYEDGHSFWHHIKLQTELNGEEFEWNETASIYNGKLLIDGDDPFRIYRDGRMNFNIEGF
ncbi:hypothetical protein [Bacillus mesophilum]|uniref:Nuclear transport factor 2 family protein n=1 Tax=Bacillus mesophilum TaxID=1071718 RepID=A0A7V7RQA1_9BACI|nr:hypothetical protein [Bacillus mesophilum]KAB2335584.1 hypothetical protein F7732_03150 [Bacillus mesophilum]